MRAEKSRRKIPIEEFAGPLKLLFTDVARESRVTPPQTLFGFVELSNVMLRVKLDAELGDEIELRLEIVDVLLLVVHQLLEQIARDVVAHAMTMGRRFLVKRARRNLGLEVAVENFLDVLSPST